MRFISLVLVCIALSSCSPRHTEPDTELPRYSDMGAAADAGQVK